MARIHLPSWARGLGRALCATALVVPTAVAVVPDCRVCLSDRRHGLLLSERLVAALGARTTGELLIGAVDDARAAAVRGVAQRIVQASLRVAAERGDDVAALAHTRVVVCDRPWMNAFSLADGTIVVYTGALDQIAEEVATGGRAEWEAAVARLLSHELAHVAAQHVVERANSLPVAVALSAALPLAPGTAVVAAVAYLLARELPTWRALELEADAIGATMMASAGFDPRAAATSLRARAFAPEIGDLLPGGYDGVLEALHVDAHAPIPTVLCSHPHDAERAASLEALYPAAAVAAGGPWALDARLI